MSPTVRVALCGALGGGTNAWLCFARVPVPVKDNPNFGWHLIPAGAVHGAVLAIVSFGLGTFLSRRTVRARLAAALPLAWLAGFASWIPLNRSAFDEPWAKSVAWPFHQRWDGALLGPLQYFGFVALLYYAAVAFGLTRHTRLAPHVACASAAGVLGSLWWWSAMEPWYLSILHGAIWGACVGVGAWASHRGANLAQGVA